MFACILEISISAPYHVDLIDDQSLQRSRIVVEALDRGSWRRCFGNSNILCACPCDADTIFCKVAHILYLVTLLADHQDVDDGIRLRELHDLGAIRIHAHNGGKHIDFSRDELRDAVWER